MRFVATSVYVLALCAACGVEGPSAGDSAVRTSDGGGSGQWGAELQYCVDVTNSYRAQISRPALTRSTALEAYATEDAAYDAAHPTPDHAHFRATNGGGVALAENEVPGWPLASYGSVSGVIDGGLAMMWNETPPFTGHRDNLASSSYTRLGCGIYVSPAADVWVVQDFN